MKRWHALPVLAILLARPVALWATTSPDPLPAPPAANSVSPKATIEWKATKEDGVYGYLIYRAEAREGPFLRLGSEIIHTSKEPGEIHAYRFEDTTVEPGKTYFYYLDKIASSGEKSRFSGVAAKSIPIAQP